MDKNKNVKISPPPANAQFTLCSEHRTLPQERFLPPPFDLIACLKTHFGNDAW
jgi:hypothetical protein